MDTIYSPNHGPWIFCILPRLWCARGFHRRHRAACRHAPWIGAPPCSPAGRLPGRPVWCGGWVGERTYQENPPGEIMGWGEIWWILVPKMWKSRKKVRWMMGVLNIGGSGVPQLMAILEYDPMIPMDFFGPSFKGPFSEDHRGVGHVHLSGAFFEPKKNRLDPLVKW